MNNNYFLGIDGGGTATKAVIIDDSGKILGRGKGGGGNFHNSSALEAVNSVEVATKQALGEAGITSPLTSGCIGLAGLDTPLDFEVLGQELRSRKAAILPDSATLLLVNDGYVGVKSGTDGDWGVCIISGTGSNCFGLNEDGETASAGDWGYILGDLGSAFAVGQKMLRMVMQEYDGRKRRSVISEYVLRHLQMKTALELIPWAYGAQPPVEAIASLAILLQEEEINKLREIQDLLKDITSELFSALLAVTTRLGIEREAAFPIVLTGGQFAQKELADGQLRTLVEAHFPNASLFKAYRSGGEGAAQAAKRLLDPSFILPKGGVLV